MGLWELSVNLRKELESGREAQSLSSQGLGPGVLLVGDVGSTDRVSLEGYVQFFAKWGKWFFPREAISTKSACWVKNGPFRALGTSVPLQPAMLHRRWLPGSPRPSPQIRGQERQEVQFLPQSLSDCDICITPGPSVPPAPWGSLPFPAVPTPLPEVEVPV